MEEKYIKYWEKTANQLKIIWSDTIQIASYNTKLSREGNMVVVLQDDSIENIVKANKIVKDIRRRGIEAPLIISPHYLEHSLDSFPLEFLNIKTDYSNIFASRDVFKDLTFDKNYIRLEMERELKSKELLIKMTVLDYYGNSKILKDLIKVSVKSIEPILKGLLFLLDQKIPQERKELIDKANEATAFDISSLLTAVDFTSEKTKMNKDELSPFFDQYTKQLNSLSHYVEQFIIK